MVEAIWLQVIVGRQSNWKLDPPLRKASPCDDDINRLCLAKRPSMAQRPGAVGSCLASILEKQDKSTSCRLLAEDSLAEGPSGTAGKKLSEQCYVLAYIAEPPNIKRAFDSSLAFAALASQLDTLGSSTCLPMMLQDRCGNVRGISLTGWVAVLGMAALVVLCLFGVALLFKRMRRSPAAAGYTLVMKTQAK